MCSWHKAIISILLIVIADASELAALATAVGSSEPTLEVTCSVRLVLMTLEISVPATLLSTSQPLKVMIINNKKDKDFFMVCVLQAIRLTKINNFLKKTIVETKIKLYVSIISYENNY